MQSKNLCKSTRQIMTTTSKVSRRNYDGVKCAEATQPMRGGLRHTRQCERPTGADAFKQKYLFCLLAGSLKTGGVLSGGANAARQKPRTRPGNAKAERGSPGAPCLFCAKKERSSLTVLMYSLGGACGKAAANTPRTIGSPVPMKWDDEVPNAARRHLYPPSWLKEEQHQEDTPEASQANPPKPGELTRGRDKSRNHSPRTHQRPRSQQSSQTNTTPPTGQTTARTHRSTSNAQSEQKPRREGQSPAAASVLRPPARAGGQRVGSSPELIYLKIQPDLARRERGANW